MKPSPKRPNGRPADALRPTSLKLGVLRFAEGSAEIEMGATRVLAAASFESRVPAFLAGTGRGWVTAEYAMLPRATHTRNPREAKKGRQGGRTTEIQRLIGRSLRAAVDLDDLGENTVTLDCDVLQADGGTRTAAITAAYAALVQALGHGFLAGDLTTWPLVRQIAAVSVGLVDGQPLLDLEYCEDSVAEVDLNLAATPAGEIIEIQGTGERRGFERQHLDTFLDLAFTGIRHLAAIQNEALASVLEEVEGLRREGRRRSPPRDESSLWDPP